jgi:glycosyltransferase involved in cell wall biosynthesis
MISVIIPLYNVEKYIKCCLFSFENQTYKDFEIIVVNDGSEDSSPNIVESYIDKSEMKITLVHQANAGVSSARNKGIEIATRPYICFVDSDDMVVPNYLSEMFSILDNNDCDMVICGKKNIPEDHYQSLLDVKSSYVSKANSYEVLRKFLYRKINPGVWSLLVKRKIIVENNLKFAVGYRYSEDIEMIYKMMANCKNVMVTKAQLYLYRVRSTSVMSLVDGKRMDGFILMKRLEEYFDRVKPDFSKEFRKFGVSRWVWATLWQIAMASNCYGDFVRYCYKYDANFYMGKLIHFPNKFISYSSLTYLFLPRVYYYTVKLVIGIKVNRSFNTS